MTRRALTARDVLSHRPGLRAIQCAGTTRTLAGLGALDALPSHQPHPEVPGGRIVWVPGLSLVSELNVREGDWTARSDRARRQRKAVARALAEVPRVALPCRVIVTRCARRALDDDNAQGAAKHVRDELAAWLGVDDADPRVEWIVRQEPPAGGVGVRIELVPRPAAPRTRVVVGARTHVRLALSRDERAALVAALAHPDADEVSVAVEDLVLHLIGGK